MNSNAMLNYMQSEVDMENSGFTENCDNEITMSMEDSSQMCSTEDRNDMFLERPSKRRKANRHNICTEDNAFTRIPENKIEICLTCTEKLPKQFGLAKMLKAESIKNVTKIKYINTFKVLIHFNSEESAESFIQCKRFNENGFKCQKTLEISQSYGVIKDIDLELSEEEILQGINSETLILAVKRLKRKNTYDGHWELSESVRICFKGPSLPSYVYVYDTRVKVSPYIYPVTQCSRCWRFGHSIRMCPSLKVICPKCTKNHSNCETTTFKCNNCMGKHMTMAKICPVFLKEKRIRELMAEFNCSFRKALMLYVPPSPRLPNMKNDPPLYTQPTSENESSQQDKQIPGPSDVHTYASVTKASPEKTRKSSKAEKRRNRRKSLKEQGQNIPEVVTEVSEEESRMDDELSDESRSKHKEQLSWKLLFKKLKEKIFKEESSSWEDKIKGCGNIILEALISLVLKFIADQPFCNFIKQLCITTTYKPM